MYLFWYLLMLLLVIGATAIVTVNERKVIADIQSRKGPSKTGYFGILQPIADALKLLLKESIVPFHSFEKVYVAVATLSFIMAAFFWNLPTLSFENPAFINEFTVLGSFLVSIIHVFCILLAGWSSNSRYAFLGAVRCAAQLIAYDVVVILIYTNMFFYGKEYSFETFIEFQLKFGAVIVFIPLQAILFFIGLLAEANRHPYDFPEAESELVAGFNVEYAAIKFAMFFLAEYATVIYSAVVTTIIFFSIGAISQGYVFEFLSWILETYIIIWFIIHTRALIPRYRYDQLMEICWKVLVPVQCSILFVNYFLYIIA